MSEPTTATPAGAGESPAPSNVTNERPRVQADALPPEALAQRLDAARKTAEREQLRALGVDSLDAVKAALDELTKLREASKTAEQRQADELAALRAKAAQADTYAAVLAARAAAELGSLPEAARAQIVASAGQDPAAQLRAIETARAVAAALAPPPETPRDTAPAPVAPTPPKSPPVSDLKAQYDALVASGRNYEARMFRLTNPSLYGAG